MGKVDVIAVDPGGVHVGVAAYNSILNTVRAIELENHKAVGVLSGVMADCQLNGSTVVLVVETFSLYADKAKAQIGSQMETSQLIGALKYVAGELGVEVVMQGAAIKIPTRAQMKARRVGIRSGVSGHADDAVLHLWHYLLNNAIVDSRAVRDNRQFDCNGVEP